MQELKKGPLILYHGGNCCDGFTAAWCAHRQFGDSAEYRAVQYGEPGPTADDVAERLVYILDFCFEEFETLAMMLTNAARLVIIDHHKTARPLLERLDAFAVTHSMQHKLETVFNIECSGAYLTWDYFYPVRHPPLLVLLVQDRDLWVWKFQDSKAINALVAATPKTFGHWECLSSIIESDDGRELVVSKGKAILAYQGQVIDAHVRNAHEITIAGYRVLAVNCTTLHSEVGEQLAQYRPFGATWFQRGDGKFVWSLRSRDSGLDVSEIAAKFGGGGHARAAGFQWYSSLPMLEAQ